MYADTNIRWSAVELVTQFILHSATSHMYEQLLTTIITTKESPPPTKMKLQESRNELKIYSKDFCISSSFQPDTTLMKVNPCKNIIDGRLKHLSVISDSLYNSNKEF